MVPVPLHAARQRRRGYNQSELAARTIASSLGLPLDGSLLLRMRPAPPQAGLSAEERLTNLRDVYAGADLPPERVLLVDDVTTTGAGAARRPPRCAAPACGEFTRSRWRGRIESRTPAAGVRGRPGVVSRPPAA